MTHKTLPAAIIGALVALISIGCVVEGYSLDGGGSDANVDRGDGTYASGPFGVDEGTTIQNLSFVQSDDAPLSLADIRDDPGNKLMLVSTSAGWCTACIEEQPALQDLHDRYADRGLFVMVSLFEDEQFQPANANLVRQWLQKYDLSFQVVADPQFGFSAYYDSRLTPMNMIVEVPSMKIVKIVTGADISAVTAIIEAKL